MRTLQIRSMPDELHRDLTQQATEQGVSLNRLLLRYLSDIARINRHLTEEGRQQPDLGAEGLRRPKQRQQSTSPSRQQVVDTIRNLRGGE